MEFIPLLALLIPYTFQKIGGSPADIAEDLQDFIEEIDLSAPVGEEEILEELLDIAEIYAAKTETPIDDWAVSLIRMFKPGIDDQVGDILEKWKVRRVSRLANGQTLRQRIQARRAARKN